MIVVAQRTLKFLLSGHPLAVPLSNPTQYTVGRDYAATVPGSRQTLIRLEIIEQTPTGVRVKLAYQDRPRLLARASQYGYIEIDARHPNLRRAMFDEPEAVDPADVAQITANAHRRHELNHADELARRAARSIRLRLREAERQNNGEAYAQLARELEQLAQQAQQTHQTAA
jgi:hypothetical protein